MVISRADQGRGGGGSYQFLIRLVMAMKLRVIWVSIASRLERGDRRHLRRLEGGGKQVTGREAAVGPPLLRDGEDLLLGRQLVQLVGVLNRLAQRKVARQNDVLSLERDDQGTLHGPGPYPGDCGERPHELIVWQATQDVLVQSAVR